MVAFWRVTVVAESTVLIWVYYSSYIGNIELSKTYWRRIKMRASA